MSGNLVNETFVGVAPLVKTPITDILNLPFSQQGKVCGFFEAQFYRCLEAYGAKLGRKYCDLEHRDLKECITGDKQKKRVDAIRGERWKQYLSGKLDKPFVENHPEPGVYKPDYFSNNRIKVVFAQIS
uniref:NADH dehydrogenase [ubiquinone] iron-sulfur protein 5 n=1 Tax=Strongyloides venezuelensis TaxID=75913 RepID=A0A0K0G2J1_STRVS